MHTALDPAYKDTPAGLAADAILRSCVHGRFCLPTYQILGDEPAIPVRHRVELLAERLTDG